MIEYDEDDGFVEIQSRLQRLSQYMEAIGDELDELQRRVTNEQWFAQDGSEGVAPEETRSRTKLDELEGQNSRQRLRVW